MEIGQLKMLQWLPLADATISICSAISSVVPEIFMFEQKAIQEAWSVHKPRVHDIQQCLVA